MYKINKLIAFFSCVVLATTIAYGNDTTKPKSKPLPEPVAIKLPAGFTLMPVVSDLGRARHLAIAGNGDIFVKLERLKEGKGIYRLRDTNGDGKIDQMMGFGNYIGTGIGINNGYLYASSNTDVYRYKITNNEIDTLNVEKVIVGLIDRHQHEGKSFTFDKEGNIYVNIGAPSNVCQIKDREKGSAGMDPCPLLDSTGGIWQFKTDKLNQTYADGVRYATGLRNVVGLDWNTVSNDLYVMQHGRDQLFQHFPEMYDQKASAESPAEEMFRVKKDADCGWPYCYFDNEKKEKLLNPEFGGDRKTAGRCADKTKSIIQFPGHLAPNGLLFYTGNKFPAKYKNGAFIAFHGSWNRAPEPQAGYFVVFVPFKDGMPNGNWEVFANGFAGANINRATYRPCGLAQTPNGDLYVSDDNNGTIWKIAYTSK